MVKWEALATPKDFGGLGFVDTRSMNTVLLAKWCYKLDRGEDNLALKVLRNKYLQGNSICQSNVSGGSQFWQGLMNAREWYERGSKWSVGNVSTVRFWHDVWLENCPLKIRFPKLFRINRQQNWSVAYMFDWELDLRRNLGPGELAEIYEMKEVLDEVQITGEDDKLIWALEPSGKFCSKSLYRLMVDPGEVDTRMKDLWEVKLPWRNRVQTGEQLKVRKIKHSELCKYCGKLETRDHLFFNCHISLVIWVWVRISLRWGQRPISLANFQDMINLGEVERSKSVNFFIIASVAWSICKSRNDSVFNNNLIKSPKSIAYKALALMKQWKKMLKTKDRMALEDALLKLQEGLQAW